MVPVMMRIRQHLHGLGRAEPGVDAVEQAGWVLDQWTTAIEPGGAFNAFPLFRRREPWTPQDAR